MYDDVLYLISFLTVEDKEGNQVPQETKKEVYCTIESITQSEFFQASTQGLKPQIKALVNFLDYNSETVVELHEKRYSVYRNFIRKDEKVELYLTVKAGA